VGIFGGGFVWFLWIFFRKCLIHLDCDPGGSVPTKAGELVEAAEAAVEVVLVAVLGLAGEEGLGGEAVVEGVEGVEGGALFAIGGAGAGGFLGVALIGDDAGYGYFLHGCIIG
jgi:hypothetical protein